MARGREQETIEMRTLDEEQGLELPDLIKIDVEGFELEVLKGASGTLTSPGRRPRLFWKCTGWTRPTSHAGPRNR